MANLLLQQYLSGQITLSSLIQQVGSFGNLSLRYELASLILENIGTRPYDVLLRQSFGNTAFMSWVMDAWGANRLSSSARQTFATLRREKRTQVVASALQNQSNAGQTVTLPDSQVIAFEALAARKINSDNGVAETIGPLQVGVFQDLSEGNVAAQQKIAATITQWFQAANQHVTGRDYTLFAEGLQAFQSGFTNKQNGNNTSFIGAFYVTDGAGNVLAMMGISHPGMGKADTVDSVELSVVENPIIKFPNVYGTSYRWEGLAGLMAGKLAGMVADGVRWSTADDGVIISAMTATSVEHTLAAQLAQVGFIPSSGSAFADTSSLTQKQKQALWAGAQADRIGDQARLGRSVVADILATYNTQVTKELYALVRSVDFNLARIEADMQGKTPNLGQGETRVQEQFKALYRVVEGFNWSDTHLAGRKTGWLSQLAVTAGKEDSAYLGQRLTLFLSRAFGEQGLTDTATTAVGYLVLLAGYTGSNRTKALAVAESLLDLGDEDGSIGALVANVIAGTATTHASVKTFFRSTELEGRLGELAHALIQEGETAQATAFRTAMGDYNVVWIQGTNGQTVMLDTSVVSETWQAGSDIGSVYGAAVSASQPWKVTYTLKQGATAIDHLGNSFVLVTGNNLDTVPDDDVDIRGYGQAGAQAYGTFSHTRDQIKREVAHVTSSAPWLDKRVATLAATMVSQLDGGSVTSAGATLGQIQTLFTNNASVLAGLMDETQAYTRARLGMESIYNAVANGSADIPAAHKTLALTFLGTTLDFVALSQTPSITSTRGYYADFLSRFLAGDRTGAKARFETMLSHFNLPQGDRNSFRTAMAAIIDLSGSPLDRMRALPAALEEMVLKIHLGRRAVPTFLTDLRSEAATLATQDLPRLATTQAQLSGISQSPSFGSSTQAQLTFDKVLIDHFTTPLSFTRDWTVATTTVPQSGSATLRLVYDAGHGRLVMESAPLSAGDMVDPFLAVSRFLLEHTVSQAQKGDTLSQIITRYNTALTAAMGKDGASMLLTNLNSDYTDRLALTATSNTPQNPDGTSVSVLMPYARIATASFGDAISDPFVKSMAQKARDMVDVLDSSLFNSITLTNEAKAFIFQTMFFELYRAGKVSMGHISPLEHQGIFLIAPEDAIFGILSTTELTAIRNAFNSNGDGTATLAELILRELPQVSQALFRDDAGFNGDQDQGRLFRQAFSQGFQDRMTNIFSKAISLRLAQGGAVALGRASAAGEVILPTGDRLTLSHPFAQERQPIFFDADSNAHIYANWQSRSGVVARLADDAFAMVRGDSRDAWIALTGTTPSYTDMETARAGDFLRYEQGIRLLGATDTVAHAQRFAHAGNFAAAMVNPNAFQGQEGAADWASAVTAVQGIFNALRSPGSQAADTAAQTLCNGFTLGESRGGLRDKVLSQDQDVQLAVFNRLVENLDNASLSQAYTHAIEALEPELLRAYETGSLSVGAGQVIEKRFEKIREGDKSYSAITGGASQVDLRLTSVRSALFARNAQYQGGHRVTTNAQGTISRTAISAFTLSELALRNTGVAPVGFGATGFGITNATSAQKTAALNLATSWKTRAQTLSFSAGDQAVYTHAVDLLTRGYAQTGTVAHDTFLVEVKDPSSSTVVAMAIGAFDAGQGVARIESLITNPNAIASLAGNLSGNNAASQTWYEGAQRSAMMAMVRLLETRYPGIDVDFNAQISSQETLARDLGFAASDKTGFLVSESNVSMARLSGSLISLLQQRYAALNAGILSLSSLGSDNTNDLDSQTRSAITSLGQALDHVDISRLEQGLAPNAEYPMNVDQTHVYLIEKAELMSELAQRAFVMDQDAYQSVKTDYLEAMRRNVSTVGAGLARAYDNLVDQLPSATYNVAGFRTAGPSYYAIQALLDQAMALETPAAVVTLTQPLFQAVATAGTSSNTARMLMDLVGDLVDGYPEHATALTSAHSWLSAGGGDQVYSSTMSYSSQWILQLGDDPVTSEAARLLMDKHPEQSRLLRLVGGVFYDESGAPVALDGNSRIQIVGHGTPFQVGGMGPGELVKLLVSNGIVANGDSLARVGFVGCNIGGWDGANDTYLSQGFGTAFYDAMADAGVSLGSVSMRQGLVKVDEFGRKWTGTLAEDNSVRWSHRDGASKQIITRNSDGSYSFTQPAVEEGEVTTIQGDISQALVGASPKGRVRFYNGVQVDENGQPLAADSTARLTQEQVDLIHQRYGGNFSGELELSGDEFLASPAPDFFHPNPVVEAASLVESTAPRGMLYSTDLPGTGATRKLWIYADPATVAAIGDQGISDAMMNMDTKFQGILKNGLSIIDDPAVNKQFIAAARDIFDSSKGGALNGDFTMAALMQLGIIKGDGHPFPPMPSDLGMLLVLDNSETTNGGTFEAVGSNSVELHLPILQVNPRNIYWSPQGVADFAKDLYLSARARNNDQATHPVSDGNTLSYNVLREVEWSGVVHDASSNRGPILTNTETDRMGFEEELSGNRLSISGDDSEFSRRMVFAKTQDEELGLPVLRIEMDVAGSSNARAHGYPEIITGPLTSEEYLTPTYYQAKAILIQLFNGSDGTKNMSDIIGAYNTLVKSTLGSDGDRYLMVEVDADVNARVSVGAPLYKRVSRQTSIQLPIDKLASAEFVDLVASQGGRPKEVESNRTVGNNALAATHDLAQRMDVDITDSSNDVLVGFLFVTLFNEINGVRDGSHYYRSKSRYATLFRFSPEDLVAGALSASEVEKLKAWYETNGWETVAQVIQAHIPETDQANLVTNLFKSRMRRIFESAPELRLEGDAGAFQIQSDRFGVEGLSMPSTETRVPLNEVDDRIFGVLELRAVRQKINDLASDPLSWMEGNVHDVVEGVMVNLATPDAYTLEMARISSRIAKAAAAPGKENKIALYQEIEQKLSVMSQARINLHESETTDLQAEWERQSLRDFDTLTRHLGQELSSVEYTAFAHLVTTYRQAFTGTTFRNRSSLVSNIGLDFGSYGLTHVNDAVAELASGEMTEAEFVQTVHQELAQGDVNDIISDLLVYATIDPENGAVASALLEFENRVFEEYINNRLTPAGRIAVENLLERARLDDRDIRHNFAQATDDLTLYLDGVRGRLMMNGVTRTEGARYVVPQGGGSPVVTQNAGDYTHTVYRVGTSTLNITDHLASQTPDIGDNNGSILETALQWKNAVPQDQSARYGAVYQTIVDALRENRGFENPDGSRPVTWIQVTHAPDGSVAGLVLFTASQDGSFEIRAAVGNPVFLETNKPAGTYWENGGHEALLASVSNMFTRNKKADISLVVRDASAEGEARAMGFGEAETARLPILGPRGMDEEGYVVAARTRMDRHLAQLSEVEDQLFSLLNGDRRVAALSGRFWDLQTRLTTLHTEFTQVGDSDLIGLDTRLATLHGDMASLAQRVRLFLPALEQSSMGVADYFSRYEAPVSDGQTLFYIALAQEVERLTPGVGHLWLEDGTVSDISVVFGKMADNLSQAEMAKVMDQAMAQLVNANDVTQEGFDNIGRAMMLAMVEDATFHAAVNQLPIPLRTAFGEHLSGHLRVAWIDNTPSHAQVITLLEQIASGGDDLLKIVSDLAYGLITTDQFMAKYDHLSTADKIKGASQVRRIHEGVLADLEFAQVNARILSAGEPAKVVWLDDGLQLNTGDNTPTLTWDERARVVAALGTDFSGKVYVGSYSVESFASTTPHADPYFAGPNTHFNDEDQALEIEAGVLVDELVVGRISPGIFTGLLLSRQGSIQATLTSHLLERYSLMPDNAGLNAVLRDTTMEGRVTALAEGGDLTSGAKQVYDALRFMTREVSNARLDASNTAFNNTDLRLGDDGFLGTPVIRQVHSGSNDVVGDGDVKTVTWVNAEDFNGTHYTEIIIGLNYLGGEAAAIQYHIGQTRTQEYYATQGGMAETMRQMLAHPGTDGGVGWIRSANDNILGLVIMRNVNGTMELSVTESPWNRNHTVVSLGTYYEDVTEALIERAVADLGKDSEGNPRTFQLDLVDNHVPRSLADVGVILSSDADEGLIPSNLPENLAANQLYQAAQSDRVEDLSHGLKGFVEEARNAYGNDFTSADREELDLIRGRMAALESWVSKDRNIGQLRVASHEINDAVLRIENIMRRVRVKLSSADQTVLDTRVMELSAYEQPPSTAESQAYTWAFVRQLMAEQGFNAGTDLSPVELVSVLATSEPVAAEKLVEKIYEGVMDDSLDATAVFSTFDTVMGESASSRDVLIPEAVRTKLPGYAATLEAENRVGDLGLLETTTQDVLTYVTLESSTLSQGVALGPNEVSALWKPGDPIANFTVTQDASGDYILYTLNANEASVPGLASQFAMVRQVPGDDTPRWQVELRLPVEHAVSADGYPVVGYRLSRGSETTGFTASSSAVTHILAPALDQGLLDRLEHGASWSSVLGAANGNATNIQRAVTLDLLFGDGSQVHEELQTALNNDESASYTSLPTLLAAMGQVRQAHPDAYEAAAGLSSDSAVRLSLERVYDASRNWSENSDFEGGIRSALGFAIPAVGKPHTGMDIVNRWCAGDAAGAHAAMESYTNLMDIPTGLATPFLNLFARDDAVSGMTPEQRYEKLKEVASDVYTLGHDESMPKPWTSLPSEFLGLYDAVAARTLPEIKEAAGQSSLPTGLGDQEELFDKARLVGTSQLGDEALDTSALALDLFVTTYTKAIARGEFLYDGPDGIRQGTAFTSTHPEMAATLYASNLISKEAFADYVRLDMIETNSAADFVALLDSARVLPDVAHLILYDLVVESSRVTTAKRGALVSELLETLNQAPDGHFLLRFSLSNAMDVLDYTRGQGWLTSEGESALTHLVSKKYLPSTLVNEDGIALVSGSNRYSTVSHGDTMTFTEVVGRPLTISGTLADGTVLAETGTEGGQPLFKLVLASLADGRRVIQVETGQLRSETYMEPAFQLARKALVSALESVDVGASLLDLVSSYNGYVNENASVVGSAYALTSTFQEATAPKFKAGPVIPDGAPGGLKGTLPVDVEEIATSGFVNTLGKNKAVGADALDVVDTVMGTLDPHNNLAPSVKSFLFLAVFNELLGAHTPGGYYNVQSGTAIGASPEDILFGAVANTGATELYDYFRNQTHRTALYNAIKGKLTAEQRDLLGDAFSIRMETLLTSTLTTRATANTGDLLVNPESPGFSPDPQNNSKVIPHTMPRPEERVELGRGEHTYYVQVEYTDAGSSVLNLYDSPDAWAHGASADAVDHLMSGEHQPATYDETMGRIIAVADRVAQSIEVGTLTATQIGSLLNEVAQAVPAGQGAITESSDATGWKALLGQSWTGLMNAVRDKGFDPSVVGSDLGNTLRVRLGFDGAFPAATNALSPKSDAKVTAYLNGQTTVSEFAQEFFSFSVDERFAVISRLATAYDSGSASQKSWAKAMLNELEDQVFVAYANEQLPLSVALDLETRLEQLHLDNLTPNALESGEWSDMSMNAGEMRLAADTVQVEAGRKILYGANQSVESVENLTSTFKTYIMRLNEKGQALEESSASPIENYSGSQNTEIGTAVTAWLSRAGATLSSEQVKVYQFVQELLVEREVSGEHGSQPLNVMVAKDPTGTHVVGVAMYTVDMEASTGHILGIATDPDGLVGSNGSIYWDGVERELIRSMTTDLQLRFQVSKITYNTPISRQDDAAREIYFRPNDSEKVFGDVSSATHTHQEASTSLINARKDVLLRSMGDLVDIADDSEANISQVTRDRIYNLEARLNQAVADIGSARTYAELEAAVFHMGGIRDEMALAAQQIRVLDPEAYADMTRPEMDSIRVAYSKVMPETVKFFYKVLDRLPNDFPGLDSLKTLWPSNASLHLVLETMAEQMDAPSFADALDPIMTTVGQDSIFSPTEEYLVDSMAAIREEHPDHVAAVESKQSWFADRMGNREGLYLKDSRFEKQIIIRLSNDSTVVNSANQIYNKHPESSTLMRWDGKNLITQEGNAVIPDADTRIVIVGHASPTEIESMNPEQMAELLAEQDVLADGDVVGRISFVGCNLGGDRTPEADYLSDSFAAGFIAELKSRSIHVKEVAARNGYVIVDKFGRKWVGTFNQDGTRTWTHKNNSLKRVIIQADDGTLTMDQRPIFEGDAVRITSGKESALSAANKGRRVTFENGAQVGEDGDPLAPFEPGYLTEAEQAVVQKRYGDDFSGDLWVDGDEFDDLTPAQRDRGTLVKPNAALEEMTHHALNREKPEDAIGEKAAEEKSAQIVAMNRMVENVKTSLAAILSANNMDENWVPDFHSVTRNSNGTITFTFVSTGEDEETRTITTDDTTLADFVEFMTENIENINKAYSMDKNGEVTPKADPTDAEGVDGINGAFAVQYVVNYVKELQRRGASNGAKLPHNLEIAIQVHSYVMMSQIAHGLIMDGSKVVKILRTLARNEVTEVTEIASTATKFLKGVGRVAGEGLGVVFGLANVGLDIYQLTQATNSSEKAVYGSQLAFDSAGLVLTAASIAAGIAGASTVAGVLGGAGAIVAGVGIGVAALVQAYEEVSAETQAIAKVFDQAYRAYKDGPFTYDSSKKMLKARAGAVIKEIDFRHEGGARVRYGGQTMAAVKTPGTDVVSTNYLIGSEPDTDDSKEFNIRERWGVDEYVSFDHSDAAVLVLPVMSSVHYNGYGYNQSPHIYTDHYAGYDALRALESTGADPFLFDFYLWPTGYALSDIKAHYEWGHVLNVKLDDQTRTIAIPDIPSNFARRTSFQLRGQGGVYTFLPNEDHHDIQLFTDGDSPSTWVLSDSSLDGDTFTLGSDHVLFGSNRVTIHNHATDKVLVQNKKGSLYSVELGEVKTRHLVTQDATSGDSVLDQRLNEYMPSWMKILLDAYRDGELIEGKARVTNFTDTHGRKYAQVAYDGATNDVYFATSWSAEVQKRVQLVAVHQDKAYFMDNHSSRLYVVNHNSKSVEQTYALPLHDRKGEWTAKPTDDYGHVVVAGQFTDAHDSTTKVQVQLLLDLSAKTLTVASVSNDSYLNANYAGGWTNNSSSFWSALSSTLVSDPHAPTEPSDGATNSVLGDWIRLQGDTYLVWYSNTVGHGTYLYTTGIQDYINTQKAAHPDKFTTNGSPKDLQLLKRIDNGANKPGTYIFMSKEFGAVFIQVGDPVSGWKSTKVFEGFARVGFSGSSIIGVDVQARLHSLTETGGDVMVGYSEDWLSGHGQDWYTAIAHDAANDATAANILVVEGAKTWNGKEVAMWYDVENTIMVASEVKTQGDNLQYIGSAGNNKAFIYNSTTKKLFTQSVLSKSDLKGKFTSGANAVPVWNGHTYVSPASSSALVMKFNESLPDKGDVFTNETVTSIWAAGGGWQVVTSGHKIFSVGHGKDPILEGVMPDWLTAHSSKSDYGMGDLVRSYGNNTTAALNLFTYQGSGDNKKLYLKAWYEKSTQHLISRSSLPDSVTDPVYLGRNSSLSKSYVYDELSGDLYAVANSSSAKVGEYKNIARILGNKSTTPPGKDALILQGKDTEDSFSIINVDGISAVLLSGGKGADTYTITRDNWLHYGSIEIDNTDKAGTGDRLALAPTIDTHYMVAGVSVNDLVITDVLTLRTMVFKDAMKSGSTARHLTIAYGNNQTTTLDALYTRVHTVTGGDNSSHLTVKAFGALDNSPQPASYSRSLAHQQSGLLNQAMAQMGGGAEEDGSDTKSPTPPDHANSLAQPGI